MRDKELAIYYTNNSFLPKKINEGKEEKVTTFHTHTQLDKIQIDYRRIQRNTERPP